MGTQLMRRISLMVFTGCTLTACAGEALLVEPSRASWTPIVFPSAQPTLTPSPTLRSTPTATEAPFTLEDLLEAYGLTPWQPEAGIESEHPITPEILANRVTYGALLDELDRQIELARADVRALEAQGDRVLVEVHWNGISSYSGNIQVEVFYRDAEEPETALWIGDAEQGFFRLDVHDLSTVIESLPGEAPNIWRGPGHVVYLDNPKDEWARGMHVVDAEGRAVVFLDPEDGAFVLWRGITAYRKKLVDGFDKFIYGFSEEELDLLWEAFIWVDLGLEDAVRRFAPVVSIRRTDLPLWVAGLAGRGDIRIDPLSFSIYRSTIDAPRQADVLWLAGLIVHEAAHLNQPGECSPEYAATQGMTFEEYGLYLETGPGQAYEQEVLFLERLLDLGGVDGNFMIADPLVREILEFNIEYTRGALGQATFPDGEPVPTCANGG